MAALATSPAFAQNAGAPSALSLAQQQNCTSCHSINRASMGPAFHDIAAKYGSRADAAAYLSHKILDGSANVWGPVPMPANTQLTPDQASVLAQWILALK